MKNARINPFLAVVVLSLTTAFTACGDDAFHPPDEETPICGDGVIQDGEQCDDGNLIDGDGCSSTCDTEEPAEYCGDGIVQDGEQCDDGNITGGDGCSAICETEGPVEICGDEIDNNDNDLVDCDDPACEDAPECFVSPTCGDGIINNGEACDDGVDNSDTEADACRSNCTSARCGDSVTDSGEACDDGVANSDINADACRTSCEAPSCGDGIVDTGEECDTGPMNGTGGICTAECSVVQAILCEMSVNDYVDMQGATPERDGSYILVGNFLNHTNETSPDSTCMAASMLDGADVTVRFVAPSDGHYLVTTDGPGTTTDTIVTVHTTCIDGETLACSDDINQVNLSSKTFIRDAMAGDEYFIRIDSFGRGANYQLTIRHVAQIGEEGDDCSVSSVACGEGLACAEYEDSATCHAFVAPTLDSVDLSRDQYDTVKHTFHGTDVNRDVVGFAFVRVEAEDGEVWGDEAGEEPYYWYPEITWTGSSYEMTAEWWLGGFVEFVSDVTAIEVQVFDGAGLVAEPLRIEYEGVPAIARVGQGEACDFGVTATCSYNLVCGDDGAGGYACTTEGDAPTLDSIVVEYRDDGALLHTVEGTDPNRDLQRAQITITFEERDPYSSSYITLENVEYDGSSYRAQFNLSAFEADRPVSIDVQVIDSLRLYSNTVTFADYTGRPEPVVLAEGESCQPGLVSSYCDEGLMCSPTLIGDMVCAVPSAPGINDAAVTLFRAGEYDLLYAALTVDGYDLDADIYGANVLLASPYGRWPTGVLLDSYLGRMYFVFEAVATELPDDVFNFAEITLIDWMGNTSETVMVPIGDVVGAGESCSHDGADGRCDATQGLTCGAGGTCTQGTAPILEDVQVRRLNNYDFDIIVTGSDVDGDTVDYTARIWVDGEEQVLNPDVYGFEEPIMGQTEFTGIAPWQGWGMDGDVIEVSVTLNDLSYRTSETIKVTVPPLRDIGETCSGDSTIDRCIDSYSCSVGNTCQSHAPSITSVDIVPVNGGRAATIIVTGTEPDHDLDLFAFTLEGEGVSPIEQLYNYLSWAPPPSGVEYGDNGAFVLTWYLDNWTDPMWAGLDTITAQITDKLGQSSTLFTDAFAMTVGLGEVCDETGVESVCSVGLECVEGLCDVSADDPCAGVPLIDVAEVGVQSGDWTVVSYDASEGTSIDDSTCQYSWIIGNGNELAFHYIAPHDGTLIATTDNDATDWNTILFVRSGLCADNSAMVACNDDSEVPYSPQSYLEVEVTEGEELYIQVDHYYDVGGPGELWLMVEQDVSP